MRSLCRTPSAPRTPCRIAIRTINQTSPACPEELAGSTLASQNLDPASVGTAAWLDEPLTSFNRRFDAGPKPDTLQAITRAPRSPMRSPLHRILSWSSPCHDRCTIVRRFAKLPSENLVKCNPFVKNPTLRICPNRARATAILLHGSKERIRWRGAAVGSFKPGTSLLSP